MSACLLIIARDWIEARTIARENDLADAFGALKDHVRVVVRVEALRGWTHGTPALIGRMADWPQDDARLNAFCKVIETARQRGWIRIADDRDVARFANKQHEIAGSTMVFQSGVRVS